jgi:hypothetical protein
MGALYGTARAGLHVLPEATGLDLPTIKPMTPGALAPAQRDPGNPKYEKDHSQDPEEMHSDPDPGEQ